MLANRERISGAFIILFLMNMCGLQMMLHTAYLIDHCMV